MHDQIQSDELEEKVRILTQENSLLKSQLNKAMLCGLPTELDRTQYLYPPPEMMNLWSWLPTFANDEKFTILEIGSREVVNNSRIKECLPLAKHIGFDVYEGNNVDLVGDAHKLSSYFEKNSVDVIISFAVFEHLAMPWLVAEEYSKILRVGGVACTFTHFSFGEHEMPWHFFQFNSNGLEALFNRNIGFSTIESGKGMPMVGRFAFDNQKEQAGKPIRNLYCSSYIITKKVEDMPDNFQWKDSLESVYGQTQYPKNTSHFTKK